MGSGIKYALIGMCVIPIFGLGNHYLSGDEVDGFAYIAPVVVGLCAGFFIGFLKDRLLMSSTKLRSILDSVPYGTIECDFDGNVSFANKTICELLDVSEARLRDNKIWHICDENEHRERVKGIFCRMVEQELESEVFITTLNKRKGTRLQAELHLNYHREDQGRGKSVTATIIDITSQVHSLELLKKFSQVVEHANEVIIITDAQGAIEYVNPAFTKVTGYQVDEAIGKNISMLKSDAQDARVYKELWQTIQRGEVWTGSLVDRRKNGTFFPVEMSITPIFGEQKRITNYVSIQTDMSEKKKLQEQFQQSQKMEALGTLVGGIAHDFNNMLAVIQGNIYLANNEVGSVEDITKRLSSIDAVNAKASDVVRQLLTFARKDSGEMQPLSLNEFMREGYRLSQSVIPESITHVSNYCEEELTVKGNSTQLQQVLMNLANNARHAVADVKDPRISCSISPYTASAEFMHKHSHLKTRELARISVADNGCGISRENLNKIAEPFFTTKAVGQGTGLGLSMVYGAIQVHGGVFEVESELGRGTVCHVYLPLSTKTDEHVSTAKAGKSLQGMGETILLVDDESVLLDTTCQLLASLNYNVLKAADGAEALQLYKQAASGSISLVFTDVVMPKMGGLELMEQIWNIDAKAPVLFASGYDNQQSEIPKEKRPHSSMIAKPYSVAGVSQLIRELVD